MFLNKGLYIFLKYNEIFFIENNFRISFNYWLINLWVEWGKYECIM